MGIGDEIMASGMARGARARGKRVAFGDGRHIRWSEWCEEVFRYNPNVALPGTERARDIEWVDFYKGHRTYGTCQSGVWTWNYSFHATPGEIFLTDKEREAAQMKVPDDAIVIEPYVKDSAPNKMWSMGKTIDLAWRLQKMGHRVVQFDYGRPMIEGVKPVVVRGIRQSLAAMSQARMYVGPEGMMHHAAAAFDKSAVVIFGGFISPSVTGYATHTNLVGTDKFCGKAYACQHCRQAMGKITVDDVVGAVNNIVARGNW